MVPARLARDKHGAELHPAMLEAFRPQEAFPAGSHLRERSKALALAAPATFFPSRPRG